jgi:predicted kinase
VTLASPSELLASPRKLKWRETGGQVGIYDATNSTRQRRDMLVEMCRGHCKLVFLETIANDPKLIQVRVASQKEDEETASRR